MRIALLLGALIIAAPSWAMQLNLTCFAKAYSCVPDQNGQYVCDWQTLAPGYQATLNLERDTNYPSKDYPYNVFRARYLNSIDNHVLILDFVWSDHDANHPLTAYAALNAGSVIAQSSGDDSIDVRLHNQNFGRGFQCSNFQVVQ